MNRFRLVSLFLGLSLTASAGLLATDGHSVDSVKGTVRLVIGTTVGSVTVPVAEASVIASLAALAVTNSDSLEQIFVAAGRRDAGTDSVTFNDLVLVMIGDGSTTSVRLIASVFNTRGMLIAPIEMLTGTPAATANSDPDVGYGDYMDPAALMLAHGTNFVLADERGSGGGGFSTSQKSMMVGSGVVASWGLLAAWKLMKLRSERGRVSNKPVTKRRTVPLS